MKTKDFLKEHSACIDGARWALSISDDMADVWDAMITEGKHTWLIWTLSRPGVFPESVLRKLACRFVRETPLTDGRVVWDLLTDERSRKAVEVSEAYADGKATNEELKAASDAAFAAAYDSVHAAYVAAATAYDDANAAYVAAYSAAYSAAYVAYAARAARAASHAARAATYVAEAASHAAYAAYHAASHAARAADAHAKAAQIKMIAEIGNPFRKGQEDECN